jgi:hypothetical protein
MRRPIRSLIPTAIGLSCSLGVVLACREPACPHIASACPSDCHEVQAIGVDLGRECLTPHGIIGCVVPPEAVAETERNTCMVRRSDGVVFRVQGWERIALGNEWDTCSEAQTAQVNRVTVDAGICASP